MTKLEGTSFVIPLVLVVAIVIAFIYRGQIIDVIKPNSCEFSANLSVVGLDNQPRPQSQEKFLKSISDHFATGEDISANFSSQEGKIVVKGGVKRTPIQEPSDLAKKLGGGVASTPQVNTVQQAESAIRKVFSNIKTGRFAIYKSEKNPEARDSALSVFKIRFPNLILKSTKEGPIASLPSVSDDVLWALRGNPVVNNDYLFLIQFVYREDVVADVFLVEREPILTASQVTRSEVVRDEFGTGEHELFDLALDFDDDGSEKLLEATNNNIGGFLPLAIDHEVVLAPSINGAISKNARLSMGVSKTDPTGEISARRVLLSIESGRKLNDSLRLNLSNLNVSCE